MNRRLAARCGAALAALGVALGAFAAHGLKGRLDGHLLEIFHTGVQYHLLHALGLLLVAALWDLGREGWMRAAALTLCAGILFFSGSLYALAVTGLGFLGMVTPLGGLAFIAGWVLLAAGLGHDRR
ncbi:MAG TPA: DUF423 domain-containing protein [Thiotrichales bacterium]|nr:DUF423 domain-containing protein [Thiotrichales bacterium]